MMKYLSLVLVLSLLLFCSGGSDQSESQSQGLSAKFVGIQNDFIPVVYFDVVIKCGSVNDPQGLEGLAWYTANYLKHGTKKYGADQIEQKLLNIGARLDIRVDREVIEISGQTLLENLPEFYQIYSEIILSPTFPVDESDKIKSDQKQALKDIIRDDSRLSLAVLQSNIYKGTALAHPVEGYFTSIEKLTPADAKDFYVKYFVQKNLLFGLAGSYSDEFAQRFQSDLNQLSVGRPAEIDAPKMPEPKRQVILVNKEGRDQAQIRLGEAVAYNRHDPEWFALLVGNSYLGEHRESFNRLYTTIRAQRGMSYGAYSYHEHFEQAGWSKNKRALIPFSPQYFSTWTYPQQWNTEFAIKMTVYEMGKLLENGIPDDKLEQIKNFQINHFPFLIESPPQRLKVELEELYYNQPDFIEAFADKISAVTGSDVLNAVKQYWNIDNLIIVVVCDEAEKMKQELLTSETELTLPPGASSEGLEEVNNTVKAVDLQFSPDDIEIVNAEELFH